MCSINLKAGFSGGTPIQYSRFGLTWPSKVQSKIMRPESYTAFKNPKGVISQRHNPCGGDGTFRLKRCWPSCPVREHVSVTVSYQANTTEFSG